MSLFLSSHDNMYLVFTSFSRSIHLKCRSFFFLFFSSPPPKYFNLNFYTNSKLYFDLEVISRLTCFGSYLPNQVKYAQKIMHFFHSRFEVCKIDFFTFQTLVYVHQLIFSTSKILQLLPHFFLSPTSKCLSL
jgi:hypothetical protein